MDVKHIAKLANLPLTDPELKKLEKDLENVLKLVDHIRDLDTSNIEPTSQVTGLTNITRADEIDTSRLLPQKGFFKVKSIFS
ncbi:MAG: Glutamyl-tRNA(Gln) amidotransferase subunit C [Candidatus Amesbacteria bacterium GW2011_GWA1_46_35]|uniref:Glutamyl-tRNA(Gln) amidotransferase subunit C n=1 Tax=Candidatus Amesbacteria bacterium GW2011_GWC2_45_19 TaxID=1618366 RepID=A0A0G1M4Z3_9BACT|nr:MAG: Glutamyl-tRNA(Gln) amidotransferase subunit C [Candidatus Amesbacteria bacterium GW2011_GWC2_45_19]KKU36806.1 MAG: Glutamyl-tRNA(Gln) amidotransferase subunit C [Candidatus Amesbacteria bacterium GW2011_GWA1_46_35]KKU68948.1 MAG: Glutamyl-tRNA(Gln) amidotransferase subunit C [Microgenomates group bacterium GW2011_GWC1_47_20]